MKTFRVFFAQEITERGDIEVQADNVQEAVEMARRAFQAGEVRMLSDVKIDQPNGQRISLVDDDQTLWQPDQLSAAVGAPVEGL